jgi:hypothetical protein
MHSKLADLGELNMCILGTTVDLPPVSPIVKTYTCADKKERLEHLERVYSFLRARDVPNVDTLVHMTDKTVVLAPRGIAQPPKSEKELLNAILCSKDKQDTRSHETRSTVCIHVRYSDVSNNE